ncbi:hypothetical protein LOD99_3555 [Oopsacas minuta]|uniref:Uncharacterized protein n=1 Tax=Oopsacas minuta TaxID=111878 RepID=A0AAV7JYQ5_9METZ|nr:hypothetical protein LOD99_3555 [Oopsacas minuta]
MLSSLTNAIKIQWRIDRIRELLKPNPIREDISEQFIVAGYKFVFKLKTSPTNVLVNFCTRKHPKRDKLTWSFRAEFLVRLICQNNRKGVLVFKSRFIEIAKKYYHHYRYSFGMEIA